MQTLTVKVAQDHIDRLAAAKKPILGLAEIIWNSVDADATSVDVRLNRNALNAIQRIEVADNGLGMTMEEAAAGFGQLGGSWKERERQTRRDGRILHGKRGQGRYRVFALCERAEWESTHLAAGVLKEFSVVGTTANKREFVITDEKPSRRNSTGTVTKLYDVVSQQASLDADRAVPELNRLLALYLKQYPQVRVAYDGNPIDPSGLEEKETTYVLPRFITEQGAQHDVSLTIIEWKIDVERSLCLCSAEGFTLRELAPGIKAPGYFFTAYLRSKLLEEMDADGTIELEEFADLKRLVDATRDTMRQHFLRRDAEKAAGIVERWKEEDVYPYEGAPKDVMEETERQMFDVVAASLDAYVSDFRDVKPKAKKLTFNLLRYALESNPASLQFILTEVVGLPKDKQDEFAALLQKTSLISMINASKIVTDRLDFLKGLEYLLYDPAARPTVKERSQLHKLVSRNTWIFGDEFFLVNNDESLNSVLRKHVNGSDVLFDIDLDAPVLRPDGKIGVVDIGLSNIPPEEQIADSDILISKVLERQPSEGRHHLIIELKRPSQPVTMSVIAQTKGYAFAIAGDDRFQNVKTNWTFWALSTRMDKNAQLEGQISGLPRGVVYQSRSDASSNYNMVVWAKSWSEIIEECSARLRFFQERLNYNASQSSGKQFLRNTYPKFIPSLVHDEEPSARDADNEFMPDTKDNAATPPKAPAAEGRERSSRRPRASKDKPA